MTDRPVAPDRARRSRGRRGGRANMTRGGSFTPWGAVARPKKERKNARRTAHQSERAREGTQASTTLFSLARYQISCGASTVAAGGSSRRSRRMHDTEHSREEGRTASYAASYAAYVWEKPNVRCKINRQRRVPYASYASYAVCGDGVCVCGRSTALARARYGPGWVKNGVRCVRSGFGPTPSCENHLTLVRKMGVSQDRGSVRWGVGA